MIIFQLLLFYCLAKTVLSMSSICFYLYQMYCVSHYKGVILLYRVTTWLQYHWWIYWDSPPNVFNLKKKIVQCRTTGNQFLLFINIIMLSIYTIDQRSVLTTPKPRSCQGLCHLCPHQGSALDLLGASRRPQTPGSLPPSLPFPSNSESATGYCTSG